MSHLEALRLAAAQVIREAFPAGEPPADQAMRNDHCSECQETVGRFAGKRWPEISVADLSGNPGPSLLTAAGFRYYLPAMMLRSMEARRDLDCFPESVIGELSPPGGKPSAHGKDRLSDFSTQQIQAILAFLMFLEASEKVDGAGTDWPEEAIASVPTSRPLARALQYWRGRLSEMDAPRP
ncbi:MAG TPA: DUF6714 family protein [Archangium sp.]|jgi:hypothetical protein|nr:DUF6714 family protein [Archangium sp.]